MTDDLRILTVRQPWAWAIIHGGKDVENRTRSLGPYRGLVAIHSGKSFARDWIRLWPFSTRLLPTNYDSPRVRGFIIGVAELVDVHTDDECALDSDSDFYPAPSRVLCSPWAMPDHHHLVLTNPRPLTTPIPARGRLGLWRPDAGLRAAIFEQIGGTA